MMNESDMNALVSTVTTLRLVRDATLDFITLGTLHDAIDSGLLADRILRFAENCEDFGETSATDFTRGGQLDD